MRCSRAGSHEDCSGDPVHSARAQCRGYSSASVLEQILEVARNIPQERVLRRRGADRGVPVPQIMAKMWR